MEVFIVRHGDALAKQIDPDRPLSDEGLDEIKSVALKLKDKKIKLHKIVHSGILRAKQTAKIIQETLASNLPIEKSQHLNPESDTAHWFEKLNELSENVMLVGHLPYVSVLSSKLLKGEVISFDTGYTACLSKNEDKWELKWIETP